MSSATAQTLAQLRAGRVEMRGRVVRGDLTIIVDLNKGSTQVSREISKLDNPDQVEWTENMIRYISFDYVDKTVQKQIKLNNPPQTILFDDSPIMNPWLQTKSIDVIFDMGTNIRQIMNELMRAARRRVPGVSWGWKATAGPLSNQAELIRSVQGNGPVRINFGDRIYLVPTRLTTPSSSPDPTYSNILWMRNQSSVKDGFGRKKRRSKASKSVGWYGLVSREVRKSAKGAGVHIKAIHSFKYADPFRRLPEGIRVGQRTSSSFYQGSWAFSISLLRGRFATNRRN